MTDKEGMMKKKNPAVSFKYVRLFATIAIFIFFVCSCSPSKKTVRQPQIPLSAQTISGNSLWEYITQGDSFKNWPAWPDYEGIRPGQSPHGRFHKIYISETLSSALPIADNVAPNGSVIIKENYDPDRKITDYAVMAKVDGYNPEGGDWFWGYYSSQGQIKAEGKPAMCIDCHSSSASDFVLLQRLDFGIRAEN